MKKQKAFICVIIMSCSWYTVWIYIARLVHKEETGYLSLIISLITAIIWTSLSYKYLKKS